LTCDELCGGVRSAIGSTIGDDCGGSGPTFLIVDDVPDTCAYNRPDTRTNHGGDTATQRILENLGCTGLATSN
jgi:hypothetical protein